VCGIAGIWANRRIALSDTISAMTNCLAHRGPDDGGYWVDELAGLALGHRRLAIIDLSPQGHQPMHSRCGRFTITFNGEIYNYLEIRGKLDDELRSPTGGWHGHSDTEVALAAISAFGIERALELFVGMFALAVWDRETRSLYLARDRIGEKPLYYGIYKGVFLFASELRSIRQTQLVDLEIDRDAVASLLRFGYIPAPQSIYTKIRKMPAGSLITLCSREMEVETLPEPRRYWALNYAQQAARRMELLDTNFQLLIDELDLALRRSIKQQMISDVPLGAFLSGGIDSSTVVALMQAQSTRPVRTFTIGFLEEAYDESVYARAVARHLGTDHTEYIVTPQQALEVIPLLPEIYDEPFADSSQVPTFLVARLTRQQVTVSLSGDGGDELFAGYPRYLFGQRLSSLTGLFPLSARRAVAGALGALTPATWDRILEALLPKRLLQAISGQRLQRLAQFLRSGSLPNMYMTLVSQWQEPSEVVIGVEHDRYASVIEDYRCPVQDGFLDVMRYLDLMLYLPDDILVKVDRASMRVGLEARAPMLDHRIVELAWALPHHALVRRGEGKQILREVLYRYVPKNLVERPKRGFAMPMDEWLRGPLREWAEDLLSANALKAHGYLRADVVLKMWKEHLSGTHNRQPLLWSILMFQAWIARERTAARVGGGDS